jgi:transcription antitermination factor NusG
MSYWGCVYTNAQAEPVVRREIEDLGYGTFLPWYSTGMWRGSKLQVRYRPMLPRYVFVNLPENAVWSEVAHAKGANRLLTADGAPARIDPAQIATLMLAHATGCYDIMEPRRNASGRFCKQRRRRRRPRHGKVVTHNPTRGCKTETC